MADKMDRNLTLAEAISRVNGTLFQKNISVRERNGEAIVHALIALGLFTPVPEQTREEKIKDLLMNGFDMASWDRAKFEEELAVRGLVIVEEKMIAPQFNIGPISNPPNRSCHGNDGAMKCQE